MRSIKLFTLCLLLLLPSCAPHGRDAKVEPASEVSKQPEATSLPTLEAEDPYPRRFERDVKWEKLEESVFRHGIPNLHEKAAAMGLSHQNLIRCYASMSLDGGSHHLVHCFDRNGKLSQSVLFRYPDYTLAKGHPNYRPEEECDETATWVFRKTVEDGKLRTAELNRLGANHEMDRLEAYLKAFIGEKVYKSYYAGEEAYDPIDWEDEQASDPFAPALSLAKLPEAEEKRRAKTGVIYTNHRITADLARLIRDFRTRDFPLR